MHFSLLNGARFSDRISHLIGGPPGACAALPGGGILNSLIKGDAALTNLSTYLSNHGEQPSVVNVQANGPPGTAATAHTDYQNPSNDQLNWFSNNVAASGFDPTQVAYHELDHFRLEQGPFSPNGSLPPTATATIDGTTYTWDLGNVENPDGSFSVSSGYLAYEHLLIHNDLVGQYGSDRGGALSEALKGSEQAPANADAIASKNAAKPISGSYNVASVPANQVCSQDKGQYVQPASSGRIFRPTEFSVTY